MKALLIRHAASSHQAPDAPLSAEGKNQAKALVAVLTVLGAGPLYSSPFRRAQETISPYAAASRQPVEILEDLRERRLSAKDLPDWKDHIARSFADPDHAAPGGESHQDLWRRAHFALARIGAKAGPLPSFVTHGGLTAALSSRLDPAFGFEDWQSLRNPDLFEITLARGEVQSFTRIELETKP